MSELRLDRRTDFDSNVTITPGLFRAAAESYRECENVIPGKLSHHAAERLDVALSPARFDYGAVCPSLAKFLAGQAERIRRQWVTSIVQMGKALLEAKRHLSHGEFLLWVETEVRLPARSAQAYMRVANWASDKSAKVAHLPPSILYLLAASTTPPEFVADVLRRAEVGEYVAPAELRLQLKALRASAPKERGEREAACRQSIVVDDRVGRAVNELASILVRGLSGEDFERVRKIMTSEGALNDPRFTEELQRAFSRIARPTAFLSHNRSRTEAAAERDRQHSC